MTENKSKRNKTAIFIRSARIISGLFLLAFITTHLLNMVMGLHSIELVDQMRPYLTGVWTGPIGSKLLMLVLMTHFLLALQAIYYRETLRMSPNDMVQFFAGLVIIPTLIPHAIGIGAMNDIFSDASYGNLMKYFWLQDPIAGLRQVLLVGIVWVHGCLGLFIWMRSKTWSVRVLPWLYPLAVAIPVLALLGYVEAGREILIEARTADKYATTVDRSYGETTSRGVSEAYRTAETEKEVPAPQIDAGKIVADSKVTISWIIRITTGLVVLTLFARFIRLSRRRKDIVEIDYLRGPIIKEKTGPTLLDIARHNDLPHANICHGRGRCGTCRVRVLSTSEDLPPPSQLEQDTLDRMGAGQNERLACQLRPLGGQMLVERMFAPDYTYERPEKPARPEPEAV